MFVPGGTHVNVVKNVSTEVEVALCENLKQLR